MKDAAYILPLLSRLEREPLTKGAAIAALDDGHGLGLRLFRTLEREGYLDVEVVRVNLKRVHLTAHGKELLATLEEQSGALDDLDADLLVNRKVDFAWHGAQVYARYETSGMVRVDVHKNGAVTTAHGFNLAEAMAKAERRKAWK